MKLGNFLLYVLQAAPEVARNEIQQFSILWNNYATFAFADSFGIVIPEFDLFLGLISGHFLRRGETTTKYTIQQPFG